MNNLLKLLLSMTLSGALAALLVLALKTSSIGRRFSKTWQYYAWILVVLRLLLPLSPTITLPGSIVPTASNPSIAPAATARPAAATPAGTVPAATTRSETSDQTAGRTTVPAATERGIWSAPALLLMLWALGVLAVLTYNITGYARYRRMVRQTAVRVTDDRLLAILDACRHETHTRVMPALFTSTLVTSPIFLGGPHAAIVLPGRPATDAELRYALLHELTHARRHDDLLKWAAVIATGIHWFNPLAYVVQHELDRSCELACDEAVTRRFSADDRHGYGSMLLAVASAAGAPSPAMFSAMIEDKRNIRERLGIIMSSHMPTRRTVVSSVITAFLIAGIAFFAGCSFMTEQKGMQQPGTLSQIRMITQKTGWTLTTDDQVLRTDDGGASWKNVSMVTASSPGEQAPVAGACFFSASQASVAIVQTTTANGMIATVYTTTDAGRDWTSARIPRATDWEKDDTQSLFVDFPDPSRGYVLVTSSPGLGMMSKALYTTADGGASFTFVKDITGYSDEQGRFFGIEGYPTGIAFSSAKIGFVTCSYRGQSDPQIYKTADGGTTWGLASQKIPTGTAAYQLTFPAGEKPSRKDSGTYIDAYSPVFTGTGRQDGTMLLSFVDSLGNQRRRIYRTTDGGATWTPGEMVGNSVVQSCSFVDGNNGYGLDEKGNLFATQDGGVNWAAVSTGKKVSVLLLVNRTSSGYNAVPVAWNLDQHTLQGTQYLALGISNPDAASNPVWSDGSCITLVNAGNAGKKNIISLLSVDTQLVVPSAQNNTAGRTLCRWFAAGSNAFVYVPLTTTPSASATTLDRTAFIVTEDLTLSSRTTTLQAKVPSGLTSLTVLYGSGDENNGFVLARGKTAGGTSEALWLLRMKNGKATWIQCSSFSKGLLDGSAASAVESTDFARVGSLLYIVRAGGRVACIDTSAAAPAVTWPAALNDLLEKLRRQGPAGGSPQLKLGSDDGVLLLEYPSADGTEAFYALDASGTVLGSLRCTTGKNGASLAAYDAGGRLRASLPVKDISETAWQLALPSVDLVQWITPSR